jgi:hypothetical protein
MVPAGSDRVSRAPPYSGYRQRWLSLRVRGYHPLRPRFPAGSASHATSSWRPYNPGPASTAPVWAAPRSLAATGGITLVFFSSGYLDVSVLRVRLPITRDTRPSAGWVAPFGHLRIDGYVPLPAAFRSLSRPSSPLGA